MDNDDLNKDLDDHADLIRATKTIIQLYTDKAHFIYELLQNAEDCKATKINFAMFLDRLEVLHNGKPFTQDNLTSIRSVANTTKSEEANAIGKFGVGFKSVFGICKTVILICEPSHYKEQKNDYLQSFAHKIENFRYLCPLEKNYIDLPDEYTTKYIFPFCVDEDFSGYKTIETLHENLSKRLRKLGTSVLLFMKNIKEISYSVNEISDELNCNGSYLLEKKEIKKNCFKVTGTGVNYIDNISYLMYCRPTKYNKDVNIAFACKWENNTPIFSATPEKHICVYFPTDTPSNVNFVVQAPYGTTPNRGGIPNTEENIYLSNELATLLHNAVLDIRDRKWLKLEFLNFLPLDKDKDYDLLQSLHEKMIKLINEECLLLTINENDYTNKENAYIVRGKEIADLFSNEKLCNLTGNQKAKWLPTYFTDKAPELYELHSILIKQFLVKEIEANNLPSLLRNNVNFLKSVDDEWLVLFYKYLYENQKGMLGANKDFASVPIIKTRSGEFVEAYTYDKNTRNWKPEVFIFPKNANKVIEGFKFVDEFVVERCREFFDEMKISEPDEYDYLVEELKNKYNDENVSDEDGVSQLKRAIKCLKEKKYLKDVIEEFRNRLFLKCVLIRGNWNWSTCVLNQLYHKKDNMTDVLIIEYFSGTQCDVGIIDEEFYIQYGITSEDLRMLGKCLCIKSTVANHFEYDEWYECSSRCWNNGDFRRRLNFDYIEDVLNCINQGDKNKSKLLFTMLKKVENYLEGEHFRGSQRRALIHCKSVIVEKIKNKKWLYNNTGNLACSCEITRNELDVNLYGEVDRYSKLYDILEFKEDNTDVVMELLKDLSEEKIYQILELRGLLRKPEIEDIYDPTAATENEEPPTENISDIEKLINGTIKAYNEAEPVKYEYIMQSKRTSGGKEREHIKYRYNGFCQRCHHPYKHWEATEIFLEPKKELEQMYLSFCPNCAAEYRRLRNDPTIMEDFKQQLIDSEFGTEEIKLTDGFDIYLTKKHLAEIKIILTEMEKSQ